MTDTLKKHRKNNKSRKIIYKIRGGKVDNFKYTKSFLGNSTNYKITPDENTDKTTDKITYDGYKVDDIIFVIDPKGEVLKTIYTKGRKVTVDRKLKELTSSSNKIDFSAISKLTTPLPDNIGKNNGYGDAFLEPAPVVNNDVQRVVNQPPPENNGIDPSVVVPDANTVRESVVVTDANIADASVDYFEKGKKDFENKFKEKAQDQSRVNIITKEDILEIYENLKETIESNLQIEKDQKKKYIEGLNYMYNGLIVDDVLNTKGELYKKLYKEVLGKVDGGKKIKQTKRRKNNKNNKSKKSKK
jgi:hypothetical protein